MCNAQLTEPHETVLRLVYSASSVNLVGCRIGCDAEIFLLFLPDEFPLPPLRLSTYRTQFGNLITLFMSEGGTAESCFRPCFVVGL